MGIKRASRKRSNDIHFNAANVVEFKTHQKKQQVNIIPRNKNQETYLLKLLDSKKHIVFGIGPAGTGKAQPLDAKIKIPGGWTTMGDISPGDIISTPDGKTASVVEIFPQGFKETFIIELKDGRKTECCGDHLWEVFYDDYWRHPRIMTTVDIIELQKTHHKPLHIRLPEHEEIDDIDLPIDPYLLGALLGDGSFATYPKIGMSSSDEEIINKLNSICKDDGIFLYKDKYDYIYHSNACRASSGKLGVFNTDLQTKINELGLFGTNSHTKFIPEIYLNASKNQKIKLLQGLFDTDAYCLGNNEFVYTTTSKMLADSVVYLIRSIGGAAKTSTKIPKYTYLGEKKLGKLAYDVRITYKDIKSLVTLERKISKLTNESQYSKKGNLSIKSITPSGVKECQCILIDSQDHLYITDEFIVTHNTLLAVQVAIKMFKEGAIDQIVVTRPAVSVDEELGFLPGTLEQKMAPWTRPIFDIFKEYWTAKEIAGMLEEGIIEIAPLAFMRGRTFRNSFIIADEMQLSTPNQMKMLLTRIGEGSKMAVTGDLEQADRGEDNGLKDFLRLADSTPPTGFEIVRFDQKDVERHQVVKEILNIYNK